MLESKTGTMAAALRESQESRSGESSSPRLTLASRSSLSLPGR